MGNIIILDENTSNQIAAGEVVERPASVVKELVENSIDAKAKNITIEIKKGGISFIRIIDDGTGINEDDLEIAFERHATSKIRSSDDLNKIYTMGFRGEALSSIASVSKIELTSKIASDELGTSINIAGGKVLNFGKKGATKGTNFIVKELFYNTPARFKFLKKDSTEAGYISDIISKLAIGHPEISFKFISNGKTLLHTPGDGELKSAIYCVYGSQTTDCLIEIGANFKPDALKAGIVKINGYIGKPEIARASRNYQLFYINGRIIKSKILLTAVEQAFKTYVMKNKFPFLVLKLNLNPHDFDINVHPTKMEVRFKDEKEIFQTVYYTIKTGLMNSNLIVNKIIKDGLPDTLIEKPQKKVEDNKPNIVVSKDFNEKEVGIKDESKDESKDEFKDEQSDKLKFNSQNQELKEHVLEPDINRIKSFSEKTGKMNVVHTYNKMKNALENNDYLQEIGNNYLEEKKINNLKRYEDDLKSTQNIIKNENENLISQQTINYQKVQDIRLSPEEVTIYNEKDKLLKARIVGQFFITYIIAENENIIYLVDQHAAHERILFERLKNRCNDTEKFSQVLLTPEVIELSLSEFNFVKENFNNFIDIGFEVEEFGVNSLIVRSVPNGTNVLNVRTIFCEVLDLLVKDKFTDKKGFNEEILYGIACKSAIKANKKLEEIEMKKLLEDLGNLENPFTCPHGRPVIIKMTKNEVEKMFKRI